MTLMGKNVIPASKIGAADHAFAKNLGEEVQDKGFILTKVDDLLNWARTGSMWPMTFWSGLLRRGDDPCLYEPLRSGSFRMA